MSGEAQKEQGSDRSLGCGKRGSCLLRGCSRLLVGRGCPRLPSSEESTWFVLEVHSYPQCP